MASQAATPSVISTEYLGRIAIVTIANEKKLNALNQEQYFDLAQALREVATHDEVVVTILIGKGRYFSAGADVTTPRSFTSPTTTTTTTTTPTPTSNASNFALYLRTFATNNLNLTHAFYTHPKILVVALNGPVIGLSAALTAFADFIYAVPTTFLLTPFSSLGLVAEGGASRAFIQRLGIGKANEALIMSKKITVAELVQVGYVNKVFSDVGADGAGMREAVVREVEERMGEHLVGSSLLGIKKLIRAPEREKLDAQNVEEVFRGIERFMSGVPQDEFRKIAEGKKRHKL